MGFMLLQRNRHVPHRNAHVLELREEVEDVRRRGHTLAFVAQTEAREHPKKLPLREMSRKRRHCLCVVLAGHGQSLTHEGGKPRQ